MVREMIVRELIDNLGKSGCSVVDVRSPAEFADMTIPGSINIPLFNNEERAEVGTLYKQVSVEAAKDRGLEVVSAKLPDFIRSFQKLEGELVIFCWRGGMRSKTTVSLLELMGVKARRLQGGVKAYRRWVMEQLELMDIHPPCFVLNGGTGTGKTAILHKLQKKGVPTLDLEGVAKHRGSVFGQIGLPSVTQKMFEARLIHEILLHQQAPYLVFEAESKRMGKKLLPDFLMEKKQQATHIYLEMPLEVRVQHILNEYRPWEHHDECVQAFHKIKKHIHTPIAVEIEAQLALEHYQTAIELLLEHYYDPRYLHSGKEYSECEKIVIQAENIEVASREIANYLKSHCVIS
ncbi:MAG: tRNA 2-selenouridine(34) synthase MnmH [Bacillota bacterium]